ncbi:hypothetical protein OROMI_006287 [Orobanche minor]
MFLPFKSMENPTQSHGFGADPPRENPPSNNLWIGNVSSDVNETELKSLFEKYGKIDSVTTYPSRNYAFIYFKDVDAAKSARQGLQGHVLRRSSLKIEFAKLAKPCKSLWVAGISQSVSKEELEKEFLRYGKIQEFRFLRDRNTAFVDYVGLEEATQALKNMNGKRIGDSQIRVDFLRSQSSRRGSDAKESQFSSWKMVPSDLRWMEQDCLNNYPGPSLSGSKRKNQFIPMGSQYGDALPSRVLWIRHPPSVILEEDMLHNAMILFGEIERIKTYTDKNYALVEFRSVEEASRAKEGLQGKLFSDPRILIDYFNDELPGVGGHVGEHLFQPVQMDMIGLNRPVLVGNNPGRPPSLGIHGPDLHMRPPPVGPHSTFEPAHHGPEFIDFAAAHKLQNRSPQTQLGRPAWRRSSPTPVLVSSPSSGFNVPNRSVSGARDVFDANQLQRESKRSKFDVALPPERTENQGDQYRLHSLRNGGASGSLTRGTTGLGQRHAESDCIWRGLIAKGGTPVCRARCVPLGEGLGTDIPDVVNCSARTGLDLLSKHYDDAIGFGTVFFLPDSEEDFASYTEFLRYLGSKDRAGVAKFDDGTTLFLVPPSEFLTKVLKVSGPDRLYGVVLKFPQVVPSSPTLNAESIPRQYADPLKIPTLLRGYGTSEERVSLVDNSRVLLEDFKFPPNVPVPVTSSFSGHAVPPISVASQAGLALTPELIATLTSLLPAKNGSSGPQTLLLPQTSSLLGVTSNVASGVNTNIANWKHENQALGHNGQFVQQLGGPINSPLQHSQMAQAAPIVSSKAGEFQQTLNPYSQIPGHTNTSLKSMAPVIPLQSGPISLAPETNQHYQQGNNQDAWRDPGMDSGIDSLKSYNSSILQQPAYHVALSNQSHVNAVSMLQPYIPRPSEMGPTHQSQPLQMAPFGVTQENAETEADKNERYKTTLLFAANLLSRIHQPSGN